MFAAIFTLSRLLKRMKSLRSPQRPMSCMTVAFCHMGGEYEKPCPPYAKNIAPPLMLTTEDAHNGIFCEMKVADTHNAAGKSLVYQAVQDSVARFVEGADINWRPQCQRSDCIAQGSSGLFWSGDKEAKSNVAPGEWRTSLTRNRDAQVDRTRKSPLRAAGALHQSKNPHARAKNLLYALNGLRTEIRTTSWFLWTCKKPVIQQKYSCLTLWQSLRSFLPWPPPPSSLPSLLKPGLAHKALLPVIPASLVADSHSLPAVLPWLIQHSLVLSSLFTRCVEHFSSTVVFSSTAVLNLLPFVERPADK